MPLVVAEAGSQSVAEVEQRIGAVVGGRAEAAGLVLTMRVRRAYEPDAFFGIRPANHTAKSIEFESPSAATPPPSPRSNHQPRS